ncbi:MAG: acetyl-CoA carboxylase biotin carboxylase subunit [Conexivisphaerales archaeon]
MYLFRKVLVANRGEIAVRVIRTLKLLGIQSVAVYSEADKDSMHVGMADEAYPIGQSAPQQSYLNKELLVETALRAGADAIHPGYGFLAENSEFAGLCEKRGVTFVGPSSRTLELTGNKSKCRELASSVGVPITPGSKGEVQEISKAKEIAEKIGYPVLVKSAYGGGGRGIREVKNSKQLEEIWNLALGEAAGSFGRASLYIEKLVKPARHVEMQIIADSYGKVVYLGERECSIQRRHQKLIEITPSPVINEADRKKLGEYAVKIARAVSYTNAGTVEFLRDSEGNFYFMEVNSRLQVEHPITEEVTGIDIVREQIAVASGERLNLEQEQIRPAGAAIECRITAEDPLNDFAPDSGTISSVRFPGGRGVRVDSYVTSGTRVPEYYDSLVAKIITKANTLDEARKLMLVALDELSIEGIKTNIPFHKEVLSHDSFINWQLNTDFIQDNAIIERLKRKEEERVRRIELYGAMALSVMLSRGIHLQTEQTRNTGRNKRIVRGERFFDVV